MNDLKHERIEQLANAVRRACGLETPVDLNAAVECLNGTLELQRDAEFEARIEKTENGTAFRILLRNDVDPRRMRFSIAHELGHLFLHMGYLLDEQRWRAVASYGEGAYDRYGFGTEEYEANRFAAALLMPRTEFQQVAAEHLTPQGYNLTEIASSFHVTPSAALTRGRWLGLFPWE